jgi:energy-coupling factor transporter ATP-binding protein EcfA2
MFPPTAYHSEGHQDSMGLCLFLALAERLTKGLVDTLVLDDVILSIDKGHRRNVARLLRNDFAGKQLIITTHDEYWRRELINEAVVKRTAVHVIRGWDLAIGPTMSNEDQPWSAIEHDLSKNDVPAGAARLRWHMEEYYEAVCDHLGAYVQYRTDGKYDAGAVLFPALEAQKSLLKTAIKAAQSWGESERLLELEAIETLRKEAKAAAIAQQWMINEGVHFSHWNQLSPAEFIPVVDAFKNLAKQFSCEDCGALISLIRENNKDVMLRCACPRWAFNLQAKPQS